MAERPREKLWVVRPGDGATVADIVRHAGEPPDAIDEGRVFLGKKRVTRADQAVRAGDAVRIGQGRAPDDGMVPAVHLLFVEGGLAACVKPAGLPTVPDRAGAARSLVAVVATMLRKRPDELRVTSRLDRDVSGVVVFALDEAAEQRLKQARAEGKYARRYVALASTSADAASGGTWTAPIGRATDPHLRRARGPEAKEATTHWRELARTRPVSTPGARGGPTTIALLAVDPVTGRTHQIRVHASDAGMPLVGDRDYGGPTRLVLGDGSIVSTTRIGLHAARVVVPGERGPIEAIAPIPSELSALWTRLGGDAGAWEQAIAAVV